MKMLVREELLHRLASERLADPVHCQCGQRESSAKLAIPARKDKPLAYE
jgi:hypothetical protein